MEDEFPGQLLHQSVLWDNYDLLKDLLEGDQRSFINSKDKNGRTLLFSAVSVGSVECVKILLDSGAHPDLTNSNQDNKETKTVLHIAVENGSIEIVQLLIDHSANIFAKDEYGNTPLDIAEQCGYVHIRNLLKKAADEFDLKSQQIYDDLRLACFKNDCKEVRRLLTNLNNEAELVVNSTPNGANTLLFKACEEGKVNIVNLLLEFGADGRVHPITKFSPLYIACYNGHKSIVIILLEKFPHLINIATFEKSLPIHAAALQNHTHLVELLLYFNYPKPILITLTDKTQMFEFKFAFDLNAQDSNGRTVLYIACLFENSRLIDLLVKFRLPAKKIVINHKLDTPLSKSETSNSANVSNSSCDNSSKPKQALSSRKLSSSIFNIINKLSTQNRNSYFKTNEMDENDNDDLKISPLNYDIYCNNQTETALHAAIRKKQYLITSALLQNGSDPNLPIHCFDSDSCFENDGNKIGSTSLTEACKNRDASLVELLIRYGARDDNCLALITASKNNDSHLVSKLLSLRSFPDPEFKINKKLIEFKGTNTSRIMETVTFSSMFPTIPVMVNWYSLKCITSIKQQWLVNASISHNIKLKLNLQNQTTALLAITRLDLSNNNLESIPFFIFQLPSLRILNLSQNCLTFLPESELESPTPLSSSPSPSTSLSSLPKSFAHNRLIKSKSFASSISSTASSWFLPCLEELYLQSNQLSSLPSCLFDLPSLHILNLSDNQLSTLPSRIWFAPKLRELNLSQNLIFELPCKMVSVSSETQSPAILLNSDTENLSKSKNQLSPQNSLNEAESDSQSYKSFESLEQRVLKHINIWRTNVEIITASFIDEQIEQTQICKLNSLNLSNNRFQTIPEGISCFAINLTRLNLSHNQLTSMGSVKHYPANLKHLDLSYNNINIWLSGNYDNDDNSCLCYSQQQLSDALIKSNKARKTKSFCLHKLHSKLDSLKTLILSHNQLTSLSLLNEELKMMDEFEHLDSSEDIKQARLLNRTLFPNLSMLDVSFNKIEEIPANISKLANLSVFNISGNVNINRLPPEMGLLSKLWNLSTNGCNLNDPLKTMIESKKCKTIDIIGYLKSILEDSKPYARMKLMIVGVQGIGKTSLLEQLRQEGTGSYRKKPPEHWAKRMGNKNINIKTPKGVTLSTVGVDVSDWTFEKKIRGQSSFGPVTFRTWDFGGQKEYYATHQYFLSKRSLYLVLWKMIDGEKAIESIQQWLVNIQARAPNAPVIIVGTHFDIIRDYFPRCYTEELQQIIKNKFINVIDPDKCGLPRVVDSIAVSAKTRYNIKLLCNLIYDTVFDLRSPGSKERLLEEKIPATYLALEDVVGYLAMERQLLGQDPVLKGDQYRSLIFNEMFQRYGFTFRDNAELHQATTFLHENGVLLHYEDSTLKDLYFLDPQWLCDLLAHIVTIREINPYAKNGIMRADDLKHLFKSSLFSQSDAKYYIINLLNKFEVALTWDSRTLLIPSLLPSEHAMQTGIPGCDVRIPVRSRGWAIRSKHKLLSEKNNKNYPSDDSSVSFTVINRPDLSIYRLLLMAYFPSGFWSRLMTRILVDDSIIEIIRSFFQFPKHANSDIMLCSLFNIKAEWVCWQTGFALKHLNIVIFRVKEILISSDNDPYNYYQQSTPFFIKQENNWVDVELNKSSILEIYVPNSALSVTTKLNHEVVNNYTIEPSPEYTAKLLALAVDHIDTLLEDWYPSLGTRFVHTSEGKFLITRLVPCTKCLNNLNNNQNQASFRFNYNFEKLHALSDSNRYIDDFPNTYSPCTERISTKKLASFNSQKFRDTEFNLSGLGISANLYQKQNHSSKPLCFQNISEIKNMKVIFSFMIEECILKALEKKFIECPIHEALDMKKHAPDTLFVDLGEQYLIRPENVRRGKLLGRGAFGFVFQASVKQRGSNILTDVAMKMLQPIDPGQNAKQSHSAIFWAAIKNWEKDPIQYACKAYCTARQELNILLSLRHPNIVLLVGVCTNPLALILRLAPLGALDVIIKDYRRSGVHIDHFVIQQIILQIAKALEYLHQQRIIYRDLKSENVLVWEMPKPYSGLKTFKVNSSIKVDVKLADYGISRATLPAGTKGFGGTEGFMAPEIMRHNGEEEYTEKVDCFSFGMFIYELLSLHQPFEGQECIKDYILEGGRPSLTERDVLYPSYMLDLMVTCWSQFPNNRPATSQIVSIASAPEFVHLLDVTSIVDIYPSISATLFQNKTENCVQFFFSRLGSQTDLLLCNEHSWQDYRTIGSLKNITVTSLCNIHNKWLWLGDSQAYIHIYSLENYQEVNLFKVCHQDEKPTAIRSICFIDSINCVAILNTSKRVWICDIEKLNLEEIDNHGNAFLCLTSLTCDVRSETELWCGQEKGSVAILVIQEAKNYQQEIVNHYNVDESLNNSENCERLDVFLITAENRYVWTCLYPSSIIYQWNAENRTIMHKLDCSKLAPCSETLLSIEIDENLTPENSLITTMVVSDYELTIGTTLGVLIIVEGSCMRPITAFRPYEDEIHNIISFKKVLREDEEGSVCESNNLEYKKFLITIGKGYRSLMNRFTTDSLENKGRERSRSFSRKGLYAILWASTNWIMS